MLKARFWPHFFSIGFYLGLQKAPHAVDRLKKQLEKTGAYISTWNNLISRQGLQRLLCEEVATALAGVMEQAALLCSSMKLFMQCQTPVALRFNAVAAKSVVTCNNPVQSVALLGSCVLLLVSPLTLGGTTSLMNFVYNMPSVRGPQNNSAKLTAKLSAS